MDNVLDSWISFGRAFQRIIDRGTKLDNVNAFLVAGTAIAFLDLSKTFDNVRHQQLLIFLQRFHIGGTVLRWFSNYRTGRSHRVVVNDQASGEFICTKGVPQGSVLGPLLFNLYVADLHSIAARYNVSLPAFADDMSLHCSRKAMEYACSDVSKALTSISNELESRGLTVNCEKTVAMVIYPRSSKTSVVTSITSPVVERQFHWLTALVCWA